MLFSVIKSKLDIFFFKRKWRKQNGHNRTSAGDLFNDKLVSVGRYTYGRLKVLTYDKNARVDIGSFCSIGPEVCFIPSADHHVNTISSFPYKVWVLGEEMEGVSKGSIRIDDDVWIGYGAIILSGVHIGQGAVISAGAVVNKDVEPYSLVGGVPAKLIKHRFEAPVIEYLMTLEYSQLTEDLVRTHEDELYTELDGMGLDEIKKLFSWFPKKM